MRGYLIATEGIEGSGKTTHAGLLQAWLRHRGFAVARREEPTEGPVGRLVHAVLDGRLKIADEAVPLLFAADRADDTRRFIRPELEKGTIVICDRYTYSSLAYQSVGMAVPFDLRWLREINTYALPPDMVFYLDVEPDIGLKRVSNGQRLQDDTFFEDLKTQRRIREAYFHILGLDKPSSIIKKLEANGIPPTVLDAVRLSRIDRTLVVGLDSAQPEDTVQEQMRAFVGWLVSPKQRTGRKQRLAPRGTLPLSEFAVVPRASGRTR